MKIEQDQRLSHLHQLDWWWVERFRELASYDGHGWLAHGGPFTLEEQEQWDHLFIPPVDSATWIQLAALLKQSRERELSEALAEQREPLLRYPAIDSVDLRRRLAAFHQLDDEIQHQEPNAVVRRLYQGAIEEELDFLSLIEATYEGDSEKYWACNLRLLPLPTREEMEEALLHIRHGVQQGLLRPETAELSQSIVTFMQTQFHLSLDLFLGDEEAIPQEQPTVSQSTSHP